VRLRAIEPSDEEELIQAFDRRGSRSRHMCAWVRDLPGDRAPARARAVMGWRATTEEAACSSIDVAAIAKRWGPDVLALRVAAVRQVLASASGEARWTRYGPAARRSTLATPWLW
jgi:hypothetical protein